MTEIAIFLLIALAAVIAVAIQRRRKAASSAVKAECLVCTYVETCEDATAARSAAEGHHAANADHVLLLVFAGPVGPRG